MTETELCNYALLQIGDKLLTSYADDTDIKGILCRSFYPGIRDAVLRAGLWKCARHRMALGRLAGTPEAVEGSEWTYHFELPTEPYCLMVPKQLNEDLEYIVEGRELLCDESAVSIIFIKRITATGLFDSLLVEAIAARLAAQLAYPRTGHQTLAGTMWDLYAAKLREARTIDGMEGNVRQSRSTSLTEVR